MRRRRMRGYHGSVHDDWHCLIEFLRLFCLVRFVRYREHWLDGISCWCTPISIWCQSMPFYPVAVEFTLFLALWTLIRALGLISRSLNRRSISDQLSLCVVYMDSALLPSLTNLDPSSTSASSNAPLFASVSSLLLMSSSSLFWYGLAIPQNPRQRPWTLNKRDKDGIRMMMGNQSAKAPRNLIKSAFPIN